MNKSTNKPKLAYHGTSVDNFTSILERGQFETGNAQNWNESMPNCTYFWFIQDSDDDKESQRESKRMAEDSADIPLLDSKDCRRVVLEVDIDGLEYSDDYSCDNMSGAIEICGAIPIHRIKRVWMDSNDLSVIKPFLASQLLKNKLYDSNNSNYLTNLPEFIFEMLKTKEFDFYWQENFSIDDEFKLNTNEDFEEIKQFIELSKV